MPRCCSGTGEEESAHLARNAVRKRANNAFPPLLTCVRVGFQAAYDCVEFPCRFSAPPVSHGKEQAWQHSPNNAAVLASCSGCCRGSRPRLLPIVFRSRYLPGPERWCCR